MKIIREILPNGMPIVIQAEVSDSGEVIPDTVRVHPVYPQTEKAMQMASSTEELQIKPHECKLGEPLPFDCSNFRKRLALILDHFPDHHFPKRKTNY